MSGAAARRRHEEHVETGRVGLQVADRHAVERLDDPRVDAAACEALAHLVARERLAVPVARDVGIGVPRNETIDVVRRRCAQTRSFSLHGGHFSCMPDTSSNVKSRSRLQLVARQLVAG